MDRDGVEDLCRSEGGSEVGALCVLMSSDVNNKIEATCSLSWGRAMSEASQPL